MKNIILIITILSSIHLFSQKEINWISIDSVETLQKENPKPIFIDVYTVWCGPCKMMDKNTFSDPEIIKYINEHFYAVKFNAETKRTFTFNNKTYSKPGRYHQFTRFLQIEGFPTCSFLNKDLTLDYTAVGYFESKKFMKILKSVIEK